MASKCTKCGNTDSYNFALNIGLCDPCIGERLEELETQLEQHRWIPISERLPEQVSGHWGSEIVFATDGKQAWACKYNYSAEYWTASSGDITHWKPIILP